MANSREEEHFASYCCCEYERVLFASQTDILASAETFCSMSTLCSLFKYFTDTNYKSEKQNISSRFYISVSRISRKKRSRINKNVNTGHSTKHTKSQSEYKYCGSASSTFPLINSFLNRIHKKKKWIKLHSHSSCRLCDYGSQQQLRHENKYDVCKWCDNNWREQKTVISPHHQSILLCFSKFFSIWSVVGESLWWIKIRK